MLLAPAPGGRLDHQREADLGSKVGRRGGRLGQPVPGAGHARGAQHGLHLVLVPEVAGRGRVHAGDAQVLADLGQRHLELLEHGQQPLHRAQRPGEPLDGPGDLAGVERVVDAPVPGQVLLEFRREAVGGFGGDQGEFGVREARRGLDEPRRGIEQVGRDEPGGDHGKNVLAGPLAGQLRVPSCSLRRRIASSSDCSWLATVVSRLSAWSRRPWIFLPSSRSWSRSWRSSLTTAWSWRRSSVDVASSWPARSSISGAVARLMRWLRVSVT